MVIRGILYIFAVLIILLGVSQLIFPFWWVKTALSVVDPSRIYLFAVIGIILGTLLIIAAKRGLIGLRTFMYIFGLIVIVSGIIYLINPGIPRETIRALFVDQPRGCSIGIIILSGLIRTVIGSIIIYALGRPLARETL